MVNETHSVSLNSCLEPRQQLLLLLSELSPNLSIYSKDHSKPSSVRSTVKFSLFFFFLRHNDNAVIPLLRTLSWFQNQLSPTKLPCILQNQCIHPFFQNVPILFRPQPLPHALQAPVHVWSWHVLTLLTQWSVTPIRPCHLVLSSQVHAVPDTQGLLCWEPGSESKFTHALFHKFTLRFKQIWNYYDRRYAAFMYGSRKYPC